MLVFMPVLGAVLVAVLPGRMAAWLWRLALFFALAALGYAFWLAAHFDPSGLAIQMHESRPWNVRLGSYFALGIGGISLSMVLLTALLCMVAVLMSRRMEVGKRLYFSLILLLESAMFGVFMARDWSLFYVFWEATLLPLFFLPTGNGRRSISFCTRWAARFSCWWPCCFCTMRHPVTVLRWVTWLPVGATYRSRPNY